MKNLLNRIFKNVGFIVVLTIVFTSCSPEYVPNMVNSPMFNNQGEFQATIAAGNNSFDAQTAIAVTNNIGIMVNGSYGNETSDSSNDFHKHSFIEAGIGYYEIFKGKFRYEIYGGYGFGEVEGYFEDALFDEEITNTRYNRFFIQPGIGVSTRIFDGSFSPRFVLVQMDTKGAYFGTAQFNTFFEPVITTKIGSKYLKFIAQFGISLPVGNQELNFDYQFLIFNFGLNFNLGRKYYN